LPDQGHHQKLKRIIPGCDDECYTVRFLVNITFRGHQEAGRRDFFTCRPIADITDGVFDFIVDAGNFRGVSVRFFLVQIGVNGGANILFMCGNGFLEFFQRIIRNPISRVFPE
jgi:hypothetical protein